MLMLTKHKNASAHGRAPSRACCSKACLPRLYQIELAGLCVRSASARGAGKRASASASRIKGT